MKSYSFIAMSRICFVLIIPILFSHCKNIKKEKQSEPDKTALPVTAPIREKPKLVYDANGNIIERHANSYKQKDNTIRSMDSYYYKYDDRNNVIEETKESYSAEGELMYKNVNFYSYNDLNKKVEQKFFSYDGQGVLQRQARNTYSYNSSGYLFEEKTWFEDGTLKSIINTERNEAGELLSEEYIHFNHDGTKNDHKKYHYTKYGLDRTENMMKK